MMNWYAHTASWSFVFRRYLPRLALLSLAWEIAQLPLYTLWADPRLEWIAFAVVHCTAGDAMIGAAALFVALILSRAGHPANWPGTKIFVWMVFLALGYTLASERINLIQGNWTYSDWMPIVPWVEVGLAPLLQWIVVPLAAWQWANRPRRLSP